MSSPARRSRTGLGFDLKPASVRKEDASCATSFQASLQSMQLHWILTGGQYVWSEHV